MPTRQVGLTATVFIRLLVSKALKSSEQTKGVKIAQTYSLFLNHYLSDFCNIWTSLKNSSFFNCIIKLLIMVSFPNALIFSKTDQFKTSFPYFFVLLPPDCICLDSYSNDILLL